MMSQKQNARVAWREPPAEKVSYEEFLAWADVYRLEGAHYRPAFSGNEGVCRAGVLPGFWLRVEWLWQERLPAVLDVLRELGVLPEQ